MSVAAEKQIKDIRKKTRELGLDICYVCHKEPVNSIFLECLQ